MTFVYFTDRDLGNLFPEILRSHGVSVEQHKDHFAHDAPDEEWLAGISAHGWVAITRDRRIRYKPNERDAVIRHGVALLVLVGNATHPELARSFVATGPKIERFLQGHTPPFIAKVYRAATTEIARRPDASGRVEMWYPQP